jgi:hypothetical protein
MANRPQTGRSCQKARKSPALGKNTPAEHLGNQEGITMEQSVKSLAQRALDDAFHALFELSRTTPAPTPALRDEAKHRTRNDG